MTKKLRESNCRVRRVYESFTTSVCLGADSADSAVGSNDESGGMDIGIEDYDDGDGQDDNGYIPQLLRHNHNAFSVGNQVILPL